MSYNINIYKNKIYEILDFLTKKEQDIFLEIINNSSEAEWPNIIENEFVKKDKANGGKVLFLNENLKNFTWDIYKKLENLFDNPSRINQVAAIQRYKPGERMNLHTDNKLDSSVLFGIVIYINDDYEGGEIYYPELNLKIKPKERSIIIHPAEIQHEVLQVKGNQTRYIISSFVRGDKTTRFKYGK